MQRYFVNEMNEDNQFIISDEQYHHIVRVMRMKQDDKIICVSTNNEAYLCSLQEVTDSIVVAAVEEKLENNVELPVSVTIVSGLPKGDKLELIIQKGTELGASSFIPFKSARSVIKWDEKKGAKKIERFSKIALEAAEQSHRVVVPIVQNPMTINELIKHSENFTVKMIAYEEEAKQNEASNFHQALKKLKPSDSIMIVFGPEGGLTEKEVQQLEENGFICCGLGPRILRTETAPLYALSAISYHFELMG